jgi:hypothetical protein
MYWDGSVYAFVCVQYSSYYVVMLSWNVFCEILWYVTKTASKFVCNRIRVENFLLQKLVTKIWNSCTTKLFLQWYNFRQCLKLRSAKYSGIEYYRKATYINEEFRENSHRNFIQYNSERTGRILAMYLVYTDRRTKCVASYIHSHPMSPPPTLHVILPLSTPKGRLRAHGTVLVRREGTITSVDVLWYGYLMSRSAGDPACGIQRDGSYFDSSKQGRSSLHFRCSTFFTFITRLM